MKKKLQVFVSSTFIDLIDERQAAVEAILKAGHIPAGMELFTAGDKSQMRVIERWIDESDVYMLILGGRYGSIEKNSGVSYIELEYDYACRNGKPLFAVAIEEEALEQRVKTRGTEILERENPKELARFRTKVLQNMCSFFRDEKDIKLSIFESLPEFEVNNTIRGWIPGTSSEEMSVLNNEVKRLREENLELRQQAASQNSTAPSPVNSQVLDDELIEILSAIDVKIPKNLTGGRGEQTLNLFDLAYQNRDSLINGVTNQVGMDDAAHFFYFNLLPKLQSHGLSDNEKVVGAKYRRSFLNKKGQAFFAEYERKAIRHKIALKKSAVESSDQERSAVEAPKKPKIASSTPKSKQRKL